MEKIALLNKKLFLGICRKSLRLQTHEEFKQDLNILRCLCTVVNYMA